MTMKTSNKLELKGVPGLTGQQGEALFQTVKCKQKTIQLDCALNENVHINPKIL